MVNAPATKRPESKHALLLKDDGVKRWYRNMGGKGGASLKLNCRSAGLAGTGTLNPLLLFK
jgi:hypothetical protein